MGDGAIKLNIGCGDRHWDGFINIDIGRPGMKKQPDIQAQVNNLPLPCNSCDEVHAIHVLEHVHRWEVGETVREWVRVLRPGGLLVVECPDLDKIAINLFSYLNADKPERRVLHDGRTVDVVQDCKAGLFGDMSSTDKNMVHKWCFQQTELEGIMLESGCMSVVSVQPKFHRPFRDMRIEGRKK